MQHMEDRATVRGSGLGQPRPAVPAQVRTPVPPGLFMVLVFPGNMKDSWARPQAPAWERLSSPSSAWGPLVFTYSWPNSFSREERMAAANSG
jgi:hypothetical protein